MATPPRSSVITSTQQGGIGGLVAAGSTATQAAALMRQMGPSPAPCRSHAVATELASLLRTLGAALHRETPMTQGADDLILGWTAALRCDVTEIKAEIVAGKQRTWLLETFRFSLSHRVDRVSTDIRMVQVGQALLTQ